MAMSSCSISREGESICCVLHVWQEKSGLYHQLPDDDPGKSSTRDPGGAAICLWQSSVSRDEK